MAGKVADALTDNSAKDDTGDAINGSEVDANPNTIANVIDGDNATDLNQGGALKIRPFDVPYVGAGSGGVVEALRVRYDPTSAQADADGVKIMFTGDDDAGTPVETTYAEIQAVFDDVSDGSEDGSLLFRTMTAGTLTTALTLTSGALTLPAGVTVGGNVVSDTDSTDDLGTTSVRWANLFADNIGDTGQTLTVTGSVNFDSNTLFVDHSNDRVGVGTATPLHPLHVAPAAVDANSPAVWLHNADNAADHDGVVISTVNDSSDAEVLHVRTNNTTYANGTSLMLVRGDGNVGIGTATPRSVLEITDDLSSTSQFATTLMFNIINSNQTANNWGTIGFADGDNQSLATAIQTKFTDHTNNYGELHFSTRDASSLASRMVIDTSGNVGIGTATPGHELHIENISADPTLLIQAADTGNSRIMFGDQSNEAVGMIDYDHNAVGAMQFTAGGSVRMTLEQYGNVGIGTTSPGEEVEIERDQNAPTRLQIDNNTAGTGALAGIRIDADAGALFMEMHSSSYTSSGPRKADAALIQTDPTAAGGLVVSHAATSGDLEFWVGGTRTMTLDNSNNVGIGTATPGSLLHLDQGSGDGFILLGTSSDVSHALTSGGAGANTTTDDYFAIQKSSSSRGGTLIKSIAEDAALGQVLDIYAYGGTATTAKTTSAVGLVGFTIAEHNGANALANITANGNVFSIRAQVGGSAATRFLIDEDGDVYSVVSTAMQTFDGYDDIALLSAFDSNTAPDEVIRTEFEDFTRYNEQDLIDAKILGGPVAEGGMVNTTQLQRLHNGALRQLGRENKQMAQELVALRNEMKLLTERAN